jgi:subtilisin family serine protease
MCPFSRIFIFSCVIILGAIGSLRSENNVGRVVLFDDGLSNTVDKLFDIKTGQYSVPAGFDEWLQQMSIATGNDLARKALEESGIEISKMPKQKVGILDTGLLRDHPRLRSLITEAVDFSGEGVGDRNGHGTLVAIEFAYFNFTPVEIVDIKTIGSSGNGEYSALIAALDWAVTKKFKVLNMSLGIYLPCTSVKINPLAAKTRVSCENQEICRKITALQDAGTLVSAAVGNEVGRIACPACCEASLAVGSSKFNTGADVNAPN